MDTSELLQSKENIQPLRHGRVTSMLCTGLQAQTDSDAERRLLQQRQEYETLLRDDSVEDPMAIWYNYVNWIEQCHPSHSLRAKINVVLRKCINKFKNNDNYKNDERFVKICLKYATLNEGTLDTFQRLYSNNIGVRCAIFYIAWAEMYAISESYKKADLVYQKGINSLAEPLDMLKEAHRFFQTFLVNKMLNDAEMFKPTSEVLGPSRQACNKLPTVNNQVPKIRVGENVTAPGRYPVVQKPPTRNEGLQVYEGEDDEGASAKFGGKMSKIKSHAAITKENHEKAGAWNKSNKNAVFSVPAAQSPFPVHVDEGECQPQPRDKANVMSSALKPKQLEDEFHIDFAKMPLFCAEPHDPTKISRYCKDQIYAGGMEFQFEELRAIKYRRRMAEAEQAKKSQPVSPHQKMQSSLTKQLNSETNCGFTNDSGRSSLKIRPSEEARSARRKIALDGGESERRSVSSARKSQPSNFAGVVRLPSNLGDAVAACSTKLVDVPSESFINQTIHTKEAVNEMQELWFAKPSVPALKPAATNFNVFVDDSCLGETGSKQKSNDQPSRKTLFTAPSAPVEAAKPARKTLGFIPATASTDSIEPKISQANAVTGDCRPEKAPYGPFNVDFSRMPIFLSEPYDPTKRPMYCKEQVYAGGMEFQLEEIIARRYLQRMAERERRKEPVAVVTEERAAAALTASKPTTASKPLTSELKERRPHASSARKSNFAGVVRRQLNLDDANEKPKQGVPSDSVVNQTIHTKEAVNEMEKLWFAKPESPPKQRLTTGFEVFVDQSCLEHSGNQPAPVAPSRRKLALIPLEPLDPEVQEEVDDGVVAEEDCNKENAAPDDYPGPFGKSTRPVSGVLTPSENVPFAPRTESEEEEEDSDEGYEVPGNVTGVTENFTQAFQFQKIAFASTPNTRHSMPRGEVNNESVYVPPDPEEQPLDLKTAPKQDPPRSKSTDLTPKEESNDTTDRQYQRGLPFGQRTLPEQKNLSIIVETSREYKSSSSGSGASTLSKVCPVTPGESRFEGSSKRFISYSQNEKTPFASKTQSTCQGYEASGEMSSAAVHGDVDKLQAVPEQDEFSSERVNHSIINGEKELSAGVEKLSLKPAVDDPGIDPFSARLLDSFLEQLNFPTKHHVPGCLFLYSKLQPIRQNSTITVDDKTLDFKKLLGEGAYAKVFKAQNSSTGQTQVVKYQKPAFPWEFYIAREIRARCSLPQRPFFMHIEEAYFYENASLFLSASVEYGDLLSAINLYKVKQGRPMGDYLAVYFSVQILEIMDVLHSLQIIHGDIKPDNFLVKKLNGKLQLELIDFGRSIDMTLFPSGTTFTRVVTTDGFTCIEMQTKRPWTYQLDLYGVAACMHCLLFGDYMKVQQRDGKWGITKTIPSKQRANKTQIEALVDAVGRNKNLHTERVDGPLGRENIKKLWAETSLFLNELGPAKEPSGWRSTWKEILHRSRKKAQAVKVALNRTGNGAAPPPLNDLEKRVIEIVGPESITGCPIPEIILGNEIHTDNSNSYASIPEFIVVPPAEFCPTPTTSKNQTGKSRPRRGFTTPRRAAAEALPANLLAMTEAYKEYASSIRYLADRNHDGQTQIATGLMLVADAIRYHADRTSGIPRAEPEEEIPLDD